MEDKKQLKFDIDGYDVVTTALRELINQYPALRDGEEISFSVLGEESGVAMFPVSGAVVESEKKDVTGNVTKVCLYPFYIVYKDFATSENRKADIKEWLDNLGKWLEQSEIIVGGTKYRLAELPTLTENREFLSINRQSPAYLESVEENRSENWVIHISARYQYKYKK